MKKLITILFILLILCGCTNSKKEENEPQKKDLTFEAYINEGETFEFTLIPEEAVSYDQLREGISEADISASNWRSYFDIKEEYREHYEYDDEGNKTDMFAAGKMILTVLDDKYVYVDNWSRNGLEWEIFVDGEETMTMTNNGKTGNPQVNSWLEIKKYSGADAMLVLTDFTDSWGDNTWQKYEGYLNSYDMISCSGHVKLLDSSLISYKKLKDDIYYFAAYGSDEDFFVVFVQSDNGQINREDEYNAIVYETSPYGEVERSIGAINLPIWQAYIDLMKKVEG